MTCILYVLVQLVCDLLYAFVDPRIKAQYIAIGKKRRSTPAVAAKPTAAALAAQAEENREQARQDEHGKSGQSQDYNDRDGDQGQAGRKRLIKCVAVTSAVVSSNKAEHGGAYPEIEQPG
jgi:hypothetical protein